MALEIVSKHAWSGCVESLIGGRVENQDSAGFLDVNLGSIVTVCDGMGGGNGGSTASQLAVQTLIDDVAVATADSDPVEVLSAAIRHANEVVFKESKEKPELSGMGTTLTAVLLSEDNAIVAHVGDSRVYQLRGRKKVFRTWDHSMVYDLVKNDLLSEEEARTHPQSNIIMRAIGITETVEPEICVIPYNKGDRFVLCTDGFWGAMPEAEWLKRMGLKGDVCVTLEQTAHLIDAIGFKNGGHHDNLTAAVIDVNCNSKLKPKMRLGYKIFIGILLAVLTLSVTVNVLGGRFVRSAHEDLSVREFLLMSPDSVTVIPADSIVPQNADTNIK